MLIRDLFYGRLFFEADNGAGGGGGENAGAGNEGKQGEQGKEGSKSDATAGGEQGGKGKEFQPITSQEDLDALVTKRLARASEKTRKDVETAVRAELAEEQKKAKAKEEGDFKALYEAEQKKREDAEHERDSEKMSALRTRVAAKHKLPDALANRLSGTTEEELEADAKELAKLVTGKQVVDTEAGAGNKGAGKGPSNRPIPPEKKEGEQSKPAYTFDGQPKVAWPSS
jgi:hypothetical protein